MHACICTFLLGNDRIANHLIFLIAIVTTTSSVLIEEMLALYDLHGIVTLQYVYVLYIFDLPLPPTVGRIRFFDNSSGF